VALSADAQRAFLDHLAGNDGERLLASVFGFALVFAFIGKRAAFIELVGEFCDRIFDRDVVQALGFVLFCHAFFSISY